MNNEMIAEEIEEKLDNARRYAYEFSCDIHYRGKPVYSDDAVRLMQICRGLHKLDEEACNYELDVNQQLEVERLEKESQVIAEKYGLVSYHQGDPRGWSLYLVDPAIITKESPIESIYNRGIAVPIW